MNVYLSSLVIKKNPSNSSLGYEMNKSEPTYPGLIFP